MLEQAWGFAPDEVVTLIRERWTPDPAFDGQTLAVLEGCRKWNDDSLEIALTIMSRTDIAVFRIDHLVASVGVEQPDVALRLLRGKLNFDFDIVRNESGRRLSRQR